MSSVSENQSTVVDAPDASTRVEGADWEDFRRLYKNYVSAIAVLKDTLDVLWKLAPIGLVMPAILIWVYLRKIGWQQLFPEAVVSVPGLVVMIVASCLLTLLLAIQFGIPSIVSVGAVGVYEQQNRVAKDAGCESIRAPLALLFVGSPIAWLLVFGALCFILDFSSVWCLYSGIIGMAVFQALVIWWNWDVFSNRHGVGWISVVIQFFKVTFAPTISAIAVFPSLVACLDVFSSVDLSGWAAFGVFVGCVIYSVVGVLPGMAYLHEKLSDKKPFDIFKATIFVAALVLYTVWFVVLTFAPITTTILRSIGAIDDKRYVYQILKPDLVPGMQGAGFKVYMVPASSHSKDQSAYFVDSYVRFNFSNVLLLCRDPLAFNKADGASMSNVDIRNKLLLWRRGGYFCVKARTEEVRLLQTLRNS
ncbi:hypothetical protein QZM92_24090 [Burkholderia multivorans]|uniref:hypothetical protein n=1 Tax=Burkholderia multivorans TaxID=87883 RepID=UPI001C276CB6|nr:hypothetical protein [Burkholderia multivorans]MBU9572198.1 hypothetical protein [Burkholderia multivorans]MCA8384315.1 hypothetical protein [Burkholderia multivorans]MCA8481137.1 hypothetical protein [Burkholderia multivorans]MDN7965074.1 hypothetical protein [Burkholderia multivorans]